MFKLIKLVILIVIIFITLNYFNINIKSVFESDLFKNNVGYVIGLLGDAFSWLRGLFG